MRVANISVSVSTDSLLVWLLHPPKESSITTSVHGLHQAGVVGVFAEGRQLLLAVSAFATCDLEADDDTVAWLELCYIGANLETCSYQPMLEQLLSQCFLPGRRGLAQGPQNSAS